MIDNLLCLSVGHLPIQSSLRGDYIQVFAHIRVHSELLQCQHHLRVSYLSVACVTSEEQKSKIQPEKLMLISVSAESHLSVPEGHFESVLSSAPKRAGQQKVTLANEAVRHS